MSIDTLLLVIFLLALLGVIIRDANRPAPAGAHAEALTDPMAG